MSRLLQFPQHRVRTPGTLRPDRRAHYVDRARSIADGLRHAGSGLPLTEAEREAFAHSFVAALESGAEALHKA